VNPEGAAQMNPLAPHPPAPAAVEEAPAAGGAASRRR